MDKTKSSPAPLAFNHRYLRHVAAAAGITSHEDLARKLYRRDKAICYTGATMRAWFHGRSAPRVDMWERILAALSEIGVTQAMADDAIAAAPPIKPARKPTPARKAAAR